VIQGRQISNPRSYNSEEREAVRTLNQDLKALSIRTWLDEEQLVPGRPWQDELEAQLTAFFRHQRDEFPSFSMSGVSRSPPVTRTDWSTGELLPEKRR
jgi:hypothetical protein